MPSTRSYILLGLKPGASEQDVKKAYRKLALSYHPDKNNSPWATRKFHEITEAYNDLLSADPQSSSANLNYKSAEDIIRHEQKKAREKAEMEKRKREEKEAQRKEMKPNDFILLLRYILHFSLLIAAAAGITVPFILAIVIEPVVLLATVYFVIIGAFLSWHIYVNRKTWFRLGEFTSKKGIWGFLFARKEMHSRNNCCYSQNAVAGGNAIRIELKKVLDVRVATFGALSHVGKFRTMSKKIVRPRSSKAEQIHHISAFLRISIITLSMIFLPITSYFWRFISGVIFASVISFLFLKIANTKAKATYLYTPALIIKATIWILSFLSISQFGPGFDISLSPYKYLMCFGLLFLLDMIFDLLLGIFPFYKKLFIPVTNQGKMLNRLYREGYQNYIEYPVYSIIYPFFKWLF